MTSINEVCEVEKEETPLKWYERHVFQFYDFSKKLMESTPGPKDNIKGNCKTCRRTQSGWLTVYSNFKRHMEDQHSILWAAYLVKWKEAKAILDQKKAKKRKLDDRDQPLPGALKQKTITEHLDGKALPKTEQQKADDSVVKYIVSEIRPLHTVTRPTFRGMLLAHNPRAQIMGEKKLRSKISAAFTFFKSSLILKLEEVEQVCLTTDAWKANRRSFLGYTAHWVDLDLRRNSIALACKRHKGSLTYDVIAKDIQKVLEAFEMQDKVKYIVTDNGSNFVKAFKEFKKPETEEDNSEIIDDEGLYNYDDSDSSSDDGSDSSSDDDSDSSSAGLSVGDILDSGRTTGSATQFYLPEHIRCASHKLNLLAKADFLKAVQANPQYETNHEAAMQKINKMWSRINSSTLASDQVGTIFGRQLPTPTDTRWNATYDCLNVLLEQDQKKIRQFMKNQNLNQLSSQEISFLKDYVLMLKPIAIALDVVQGEKLCFLGCVLPVLTKLKIQLSAQVSSVTQPVREFLINQIDVRFRIEFSIINYSIASAVHPKFKLKWLSDDAAKVVLKNKIQSLMGNCQNVSKHLSPLDNENFLSFEEATCRDSEYEKFLNDRRENLEMLKDYPEVEKVFIQYNTPTPSSAPVERLFSIGALVLTARRNRLHDLLFEHLLVLKVNGL